MSDIKDMATEFSHRFDNTRRQIINRSLYKTQLKFLDINQEIAEISDFVESRRQKWNFVPFQEKFSIKYKNS